MKKIISLLLAICMITSILATIPVLAADETVDYNDGTWTAISTVDEFINMDPNGKYYLSGNLDFGGKTYDSYIYKQSGFAGTFDGRGFSILNVKLEGSSTAVFNRNFHGTIRNVTFGSEAQPIVARSGGYGDLCIVSASLEGGDSYFENVTVYADSLYTGGSNNVSCRASSFGGWTTGVKTEFTNCHVYGSIVGQPASAFVVTNANTTTNITFKNCSNNADVFCNTGRAECTAGFYAASWEGGGNHNTTLTFENCQNNGNISSGVNNDRNSAGGFVCLRSNVTANITMENCVNNGDVSAYDGGVAGFVAIRKDGSPATPSTITIKNSANNGTISNMGNDGGSVAAAGIIAISKDFTCSITVENCANLADVTGSRGGAGGIMTSRMDGDNNIANVTIIGCANTGNVTASDWRAGGIVGIPFESVGSSLEVRYCYNTGDVTNTGGGGKAAGIVGEMSQNNGRENDATRIVTNCYNTGNIVHTAGNNAFSIANAERNSSTQNEFVAYNNFYTSDAPAVNDQLLSEVDGKTNTKVAATALLSSLDAVKMNDSSVQYVKDFYNINDGYPVLSWQGSGAPVNGVYNVENETELLWVIENLNAGKIAADASIAIKKNITLTNGNPLINLDFKGTFDGEGHTISGITNTLFKAVVGGTVKNVVLKGAIDYTNNPLGLSSDALRKTATVAFDSSYNAKFENVISYVDIDMKAVNLNAGGLVGYAWLSQFTNCTYAGDYTAEVTSSGCSVGGIVGYSNNKKNDNSSGATNYYVDCTFIGTITVIGTSTGSVEVGGIGGTIKGYGQVLTDCVSIGTITISAAGTGYKLGGLVGNNDNTSSSTAGYADVKFVLDGITATANGVQGAGSASVANAYTADTAVKEGLPFVALDGDTYQVFNFGILNLTTGKFVDEMPASTPTFSGGTITKTEEGKYTIASNDFSAFISSRESAVGGKSDLRVILASNLGLLERNANATVTVTFLDANGGVIKSFTRKIVDELRVYSSATAAGETYTAADGSVLFGLVITGVPNSIWSSVSVSVDRSGKPLASGELTNGAVITHATGTDLRTISSISDDAVEDHHAHLDNDLALVFRVSNNEALYTELRGEGYPDNEHWSNANHTWLLNVNGKDFTPTKFSIYDGSSWGYFRAAIAPVEELSEYYDAKGKGTFNISLKIVDNATGKTLYYASFGPLYHYTTFVYDESVPADYVRVDSATITPVSGPNAGQGEGYEKAFDGNHKTKLCTGTLDTPIIVKLNAATTIKGISICNANDNEGSNRRTVINFEVWVSTDGENWGDAPAFSTTGEGVNKGDVSKNFMERFYNFETPAEATYVKLVINNGEMYQFSDVFFYQ